MKYILALAFLAMPLFGGAFLDTQEVAPEPTFWHCSAVGSEAKEPKLVLSEVQATIESWGKKEVTKSFSTFVKETKPSFSIEFPPTCSEYEDPKELLEEIKDAFRAAKRYNVVVETLKFLYEPKEESP